MKLDQQIFDPEKVVIESQKEQKKGLKHIGKLRLQPGQKVYELNTVTQMIHVVDLSEAVVDIKGAIHRKVVLKENCLYVPAINLKNAEKKFIKML